MITAGEISAIFPHHLLKPPAQFFVKPRVIGEQKQIGLAHLRHIPAQVFHHPPAQALSPECGLHIHGAHVGGQIRPGVKIVFNDPHSPGDFPFLRHSQVPLGNLSFLFQAEGHAFLIS